MLNSNLPVLGWDVQVMEEMQPFLDKQIHLFPYTVYSYLTQVHFHMLH